MRQYQQRTQIVVTERRRSLRPAPELRFIAAAEIVIGQRPGRKVLPVLARGLEQIGLGVGEVAVPFGFKCECNANLAPTWVGGERGLKCRRSPRRIYVRQPF